MALVHNLALLPAQFSLLRAFAFEASHSCSELVGTAQ